MNGLQLNGKPRGSEKPVPGCLGRMVNLFDLTSGNRLLTDKPYNDGSSLSRSRSDVSRMSSIAVDELEDKVMVSELRRSSSNRKPNGTPVKMLMAQEMSKDLESKQKSPNVVAKLMGLDVIPQQQPDFAAQRGFYTQNSHSEIPIGYWQEEHGFFNNQFDCEVHPYHDPNDYKDIYEIWQQSQRTSCRRDKSPQKGKSNENVSDKKLALIRQKFMEAKRLATDEKLRQTKEFHDALDVLSSHWDLFLKVLQEPNFLFSQQSFVGESISPSPETKRITVLRPSKVVSDEKFAAPAKRNEKQVKKQASMNQVNVWDNQHHGFPPTISSWKVSDSPPHPTRIVVLKPSLAKANEPKAVVSSTPSSPRVLPSENFFEEAEEDEEAREAREVAKEITQQMRENLAGHRRDETLLSSVFSNGYTGDESSFEKSEIEFAAEIHSDSEVMSPTSRHSWDYVNKFGSPFSSSSFSRASYSPESSVCREAKKRLSERWAMMASNGNNNSISHDQRHIRRSSSTLGEMLALSEIKSSEICEKEDTNKDQEPRGSTSCLISNMDAKETGDKSPINLLRSKSLPVSTTACGERLDVETNNPALSKGGVSKEITKAKESKTSFTGKVTNLFFSRSKKSRKEKSSKSLSNDESQQATAETLGFLGPPGRSSNDHSEVLSPTSRSHGVTAMTDLNDTRLGQGICSQQGCSVSQPGASLIQGENQDQPSPISVLEPPFEEDDSALIGRSRSLESNPRGEHLPLCLGKSNLIDKSPPIGSIARTLSWEESFAETATNYPLNSPFVSPGVEDEEVECLCLVQSLLTMAGLNDDGQTGSSLARWHSLDSPLDPLLRDKYLDLTPYEPLHEARRRQLRSRRKLVFDCVNAALVGITGVKTMSSRSNGALSYLQSGPEMALADKVWTWMKELLPNEIKCLSVDSGENHSLVEKLVRKEVIGKGWDEQVRLQIDSIGKEIEGKLLEELVEESVVEWTC